MGCITCKQFKLEHNTALLKDKGAHLSDEWVLGNLCESGNSRETPAVVIKNENKETH